MSLQPAIMYGGSGGDIDKFEPPIEVHEHAVGYAEDFFAEWYAVIADTGYTPGSGLKPNAMDIRCVAYLPRHNMNVDVKTTPAINHAAYKSYYAEPEENGSKHIFVLYPSKHTSWGWPDRIGLIEVCDLVFVNRMGSVRAENVGGEVAGRNDWLFMDIEAMLLMGVVRDIPYPTDYVLGIEGRPGGPIT